MRSENECYILHITVSLNNTSNLEDIKAEIYDFCSSISLGNDVVLRQDYMSGTLNIKYYLTEEKVNNCLLI